MLVIDVRLSLIKMVKKRSNLFDRTKDVIRDFVFGMQDGLISNLGLVLGVWQGGGDKIAILLAGFASMFAGAFSMSAGSYLSAKSQREVYEQEINSTKEQLKENPKQCLLEMRRILKKEGFDDDEIEVMCHHFENHDHSTFRINYVQKKLVLSEQRFELPLKNAITMFFSFLLGSIFPIFPFILFDNGIAALMAVLLTVVALFFIGWAKSQFTKLNWIRSGLEIVLVGIGAGVIGFIVGYVVSTLG